MKYKLLFQIRFYLVIYTNVLPTYYFSMGMPMGTKTCPFIIAHVPTLVSFMKTKIHHDTAKFPQKPFSHLRFMLEAGLLQCIDAHIQVYSTYSYVEVWRFDEKKRIITQETTGQF